MEIMLDKKQIQVIFLFEFKMGCETVEATCNINNTFGSEAAKEQPLYCTFLISSLAKCIVDVASCL